MTRRVYDCFMYRDEADMLAMHIEETPAVYRYVLIEAPVTHRGQDKPLYFRDGQQDLFKGERITAVVAEIPEDLLGDPWKIEHAQRDAAIGVLAAEGAQLDDIVIVTDVDKIPSPAVTGWKGWPVASVRMRTFLHAVDWEIPQEHLPPQATVCTVRWLASAGRKSLSYAMDNRFTFPQIADGGWHFSWLGGPEAGGDKLDTGTCHTELLGTEEEQLIRSGARWRDGAYVEGASFSSPVTGVDVDESWPAMIRERRCPDVWFRPREAQ